MKNFILISLFLICIQLVEAKELSIQRQVNQRSKHLLYSSQSPNPKPQTSKKFPIQTKDPTIESVLKRIISLPEADALLSEATRQGGIHIDMDRSGMMPFDALWDRESRRIVIDGKNSKDLGTVLRNVLFELHNAAKTPQDIALWNQAYKGTIDCNTYVRSIEKNEHDNVLSTVSLLERGIAKKMFPISSHWEVVEDFETHYKIQQLVGHSQMIVQEYQQAKPSQMRSQPYTGTIQGLQRMPTRAKMDLASDLYTRYLQNKKKSNFVFR